LAWQQFSGLTTAGVVSDTHGLLRPAALAQLQEMDLILHAGDVGSQEVLLTLRTLAPLIAIKGNVDPESLRLPETELVCVNGELIYLLHDLAMLDINPVVAGIRMVVTGHSHRPRLQERDGVLYLNPGSIGPRRFAYPIAMAKLRWPQGKLEVNLIELT
jgi:uncharacterized protein